MKTGPDRSAGATQGAKKTIVRNTGFNTVSQFVFVFTYFWLMPFIISSVGVEYFGLYVLAHAVVGYFGLLDLGASTALIKYVSQFHATQEQQKLRETIASTTVFFLGVGLFMAVSLYVIATYFLHIINLPVSLEMVARQMLYVLAISAFFSWPLSTFRNVLAGLQRYDLIAGVGIFVSLATTAMTVYILSAGFGLVALVAAEAFVSVLGLIILAALAVRQLGVVPFGRGYVRLEAAYSLAGFSLAAFVTHMGRTVVEKSDVLILSLYMPIATISFYEAANKLQALSLRLSRLVGSAIIPAASELESTKNATALRELFLRGTKYGAAVTAGATLSLLLLTESLLVYWLGPEFTGAVFPAQVFLSFWIVYSLTGLINVVLTGMGRVKLLAAVVVARSLLNLVVSVYLVTRIGLLGVILGTVISELVWLPVILRHTLKVLSIKSSLFFKKVILPVYPSLALVGVSGRYLVQARGPESLLQVAGYALVISAVYLITFYLVGTSREEKRDLSTVLLLPALRSFRLIFGKKRRAEAT